jgi:sucrose-phosphate synthase
MVRQASPEDPSPPSSPGERVLVYGEVLFDRFPDGKRVLGGAPFNVAWHLCGFGLPPLLISSVGDDADGRYVLDHVEGWGLSSHGIQVDSAWPTGIVDVSTAEDAEPSYRIPPDQAWDRVDADRAVAQVPDGVALVYHGTLALRSTAAAEACRRLVRAADATVFVDVNLRTPWWTPEGVAEALEGADWAKMNLEELWALSGTEPGDLDEAARAARILLKRYDLRRLVVTCHSQGAFLVTAEGGTFRAPPLEIPEMADTVGAGDGFCAVMCLGIVEGWDEDVMLRRANQFAADVCRFRGATLTDISIYDAHMRHWAELPWSLAPESEGEGLYILSLSVHGMVRATNIELGEDADTGGQVSYVVDQARALVERPDVERVDLVTRQIFDARVDRTYAELEEEIGPGARIVRLPFGPRRYLRKESLWPYLDTLLDQLTHYLRSVGRVPDIIHGHYADAGYVGAQLSRLLGIPFVFTGHSLGRVKLQRLVEQGQKKEDVERRYRISRRIEAEEQALQAADLVITSTAHEVDSQYKGYENYLPGRMEVIPPGVDLTRFSPPARQWTAPPILAELARFLVDPSKPMVLAVARADERKNFRGLIRAYARTPGLREAANLVLVAGNRDDIYTMDAAPRRVLSRILLLVDRYDLYGSVAYPKRHGPDDVPDLFRLAARSKGVFVNPALTEPFGLTLIEAAAVGLPVVATNDGGPRDILKACGHGLLADPLDTEALGRALLEAITNERRWARWAKNAVSRVHGSFSWRSHARRYVQAVQSVLSGNRPAVAAHHRGRLPGMDRLLITDVDDTLTGDENALGSLVERLRGAGDGVGFGIATGRTLDQALAILDDLGLGSPDLMITASGTQIHYGARLVHDRSWDRQIQHRWEPEAVREAMDEVCGLVFDPGASTRYRLRYQLGSDAPSLAQVRRRLRNAGLQATPIIDHGTHLEVLPGRASPGTAIRFLLFKWNLAPERLLVAGDSGNDADMLAGETLGVVVGNHTEELEPLRGYPRIYFAQGEYASGVLEGIEHYDFFGTIRTHDEAME